MKKNVKATKVVKKVVKSKVSKAVKVYNGWKVYKDSKGSFVAGKKMRKNGKTVRLVASGKSLNIVIAKIAKFFSKGYKAV